MRAAVLHGRAQVNDHRAVHGVYRLERAGRVGHGRRQDDVRGQDSDEIALGSLQSLVERLGRVVVVLDREALVGLEIHDFV